MRQVAWKKTELNPFLKYYTNMTFIRIFFNKNIKTLEENKSNNFIISEYRGPKGHENQAINEKTDSFDYIILLNLAK